MNYRDDSDSGASIAQSELRSFVERIERMNAEADAIKADIKEIFDEAVGNGFDRKVLRRVVNIRKNTDKYREEEAILSLYLNAIGIED